MNYLDYFGLSAEPFSTTPDPAFGYQSKTHEDAIEHIAHAVGSRKGLFLLIGRPGMGKTTIGHLALDAWSAEPDRYRVAFVDDPSPRTEAAFLRLVLAGFGLAGARNVQPMKAILRDFLAEEYKAGRTVVLMLDEAQTISWTNMETIRSLFNLQTAKAKLIQIVLLAQPNFELKIRDKVEFRSRIVTAQTLNPLSLSDSMNLLRHRMAVAGGDFDRLFPERLHDPIHDVTFGVPRDLCALCDGALFEAWRDGQKSVGEEHLSNAVRNLSPRWNKK